MKNVKKFMSLMIAVVMVLAMAVTSFAEEPTKGTITVKNATKGYQYTAYKVLDATYKTTTSGEGEETTTSTSVAYTTKTPALFKAEGSPWTVGTIADANGNYNVQLADGKTIDDISTWIENNLSNFTGIAPTEGIDANGLAQAASVKWTGLDFGYYYVTSGLGAEVTIDSTTPDAEIYDKNETTPVEPEKTIIAVDGVSADKVNEANAHVGSVVKFQIDAKTNNWEDKDTIRKKWEITDTPTNMTINPDSVVVKVNGVEVTGTATLDGTALKVSIPLVDENGNSIYAANTLDENNTVYGLIPIEITYEATIDATAGAAPAKNTIPGTETEVKVYTYAFQIAKVDENGAALPGAQFELWSKKGAADGEEAALKFIDNGDGTYTYSETGTVTTLDMTTNTTIVVKGLDTAWAYTLKEVTVPEGYNQAADKAISGSSLTKVTETTTTTTVDGEETTTTTALDTSVTSTALYKETIENKAGTVLPSTGGIGTTLFYVIGAILVLGSGVLMVSKKRMGAN